MELQECPYCNLPGLVTTVKVTTDGFEMTGKCLTCGYSYDSEAAVVTTRGRLDEDKARATLNITGFLRTEAGLYERFDETVFNTIFDIQPVLWTLRNQGWSSAHAARFGDLATPLDEPEQEERVFIVAQRA